jgi:hypothetical protein
MTILHMVVWIVGIVILPAMPLGAGWVGSYFAGSDVSIKEYVVDAVQDGQLFFYSVALGCAEGIEAWEWHVVKEVTVNAKGVVETTVLNTPYRGVIALLAAAVVAASIFFYGIISAVRQEGSKQTVGNSRRRPITIFSLGFALVAAILVIGSHVWIRSQGG